MQYVHSGSNAIKSEGEEKLDALVVFLVSLWTLGESSAVRGPI